ncbi:unnamed protein product [Sphagnum tenellum]
MAEDNAENQIRLEDLTAAAAVFKGDVKNEDKDPVAQMEQFGIFPSWGLSQNLPHVIGPHRARQVSLTAESVDAQTAE